MHSVKKVSLRDFLTKEEIQEAKGLKTAKRICETITKPNITRINKALGQKNDPLYMAYMIEYALSVNEEPTPSI